MNSKGIKRLLFSCLASLCATVGSVAEITLQWEYKFDPKDFELSGIDVSIPSQWDFNVTPTGGVAIELSFNEETSWFFVLLSPEGRPVWRGPFHQIHLSFIKATATSLLYEVRNPGTPPGSAGGSVFAYDASVHGNNQASHYVLQDDERFLSEGDGEGSTPLACFFTKVIYDETTNDWGVRKYIYTAHPDPSIQVVTLVSASMMAVTLQWDSVTGNQYQVQESVDLQGWQNVGSAIVGTGEPLTWGSATTNASKYYRVIRL